MNTEGHIEVPLYQSWQHSCISSQYNWIIAEDSIYDICSTEIPFGFIRNTYFSMARGIHFYLIERIVNYIHIYIVSVLPDFLRNQSETYSFSNLANGHNFTSATNRRNGSRDQRFFSFIFVCQLQTFQFALFVIVKWQQKKRAYSG